MRALAIAMGLLVASLPAAAPGGTPSDIDRRAEATISGTTEEQGLGSAVSAAGDVNGDGTMDLVVRPNYDWRADSTVYVVFGGSTEPVSTNALGTRGFVIYGPGMSHIRSDTFTGLAGAGDLTPMVSMMSWSVFRVTIATAGEIPARSISSSERKIPTPSM